MPRTAFARTLVPLALALAGLSCSSDDPSSPIGPGTGGGVNGPLPGRLIVQDDLVDLTTGRRTPLDFPFLGDEEDTLSASADGTLFHGIEDDCRESQSLFVGIDCVVTVTPDGEETARIDVGLPLYDAAPMASVDGTLFAVFNDVVDDSRLLIVSADGTLLDDTRADVADAVWAPDGSLYYTAGGSLFRAPSPGVAPAADDTLVRAFDDEDGFARSIDLSPDGSTLVVERVTDANSVGSDSTLWLMGSDGSALQPFAAGGFVGGTRWPLWSPDGRWIVTAVGGVVGDGSSGSGISGGLIALDVATGNHVVDDDGFVLDGVTQREVLVFCAEGEASCDAEEPRRLLDERVVDWLP